MPETETIEATEQSTEDTEVEQTQTAPEVDEEPDESKLDPKVKDKISRINREAAALRKRIKEELEPAARRLREIEDKDKSETQKLSEQLAQAQKKIEELTIRELRASAAATAGLPVEMAEFITATEADAAERQAKALARWGKANQQATADFKQGARKTTGHKVTGDDWLRRMAGRQ
jgi:TolA-binding protein